MKQKRLTVTEYAAIRGVTTQAIRKAIAEKWNMPGINKIEKFGKTWVLTYDKNKVS